MTTYQETVNGIKYQYFYDTNIKSWMIYEIDKNGNQVGFADYCANKQSLLRNYKFTFKNKI